jgi:hypothetical protein
MTQDAEFAFDRARRITPEEHQRFKAMVADARVNIDDRTVQIQTVELLATVAPDGTTSLQLPPEIPPGQHRITLLIQVEQPIGAIAQP